MPGRTRPSHCMILWISFSFLTETPKLTFTSCLAENSCEPCYQHLALPTKFRPCGMVTLTAQTLVSHLSSLRKLLSFAALWQMGVELNYTRDSVTKCMSKKLKCHPSWKNISLQITYGDRKCSSPWDKTGYIKEYRYSWTMLLLAHPVTARSLLWRFWRTGKREISV